MATPSHAMAAHSQKAPECVGIPRSPTLEAQRDALPQQRILHWRPWSFSRNEEVEDDPVEMALKTDIAELHNAPLAKRLLRDYARFKHRPGAAVIYNILRHWSFPPPIIRCWRTECSNTTLPQCLDDCFDQDHPGDTFGAAIQQMRPILASLPPGGLRVVALCMEPLESRQGMFSPWHKMLATLSGRLRRLPKVPYKVLASFLAHTMELEYGDLQRPTPYKLQQTYRKQYTLPSDRSGNGSLDPTQIGDHILLTWQSDAPAFSTDFDILVSEQYKSLPQSSFADIRMHTEPNSETTKLVLLFRDGSSFQRFSKLRSSLQVYLLSPPRYGQVWSPKSEVILTICLVLKVVSQQTLDFLHLSMGEIEKMKLRARQTPSADKLRYLVHLEDCRQSSSEGLGHANEVLDSVRAWTQSQQRQWSFWDGGISFEDRFAELQTDLQHLAREVAAMQPLIKELQQTLHEHLDLTHNRRNTIITIVAAIYVPLSFATSHFGMNINTATPAGPSGFTNWTQSWIENSPVEIRNQTRALASTIGTSGTTSYSWKVFGITAACLVGTLPLALAIGTIVRLVYRNTVHYALYWRALAVIPSATFVFLSIFGLMIGTDVPNKAPGGWYFTKPIHWAHLLLYPGWQSNHWRAVLSWVFVGGYWACNGIFLLFALLRAYIPFNNGRPSGFWFFMVFVFGACVTADLMQWRYITLQYVPTMMVPWFILVLTWFRPWWRSRQKEQVVKVKASGASNGV